MQLDYIENIIFKNMEKEFINDNVDTSNSTYTYDGVLVPRVSTILSTMQHDDFLVEWANRVGLYQRKKSSDIKDLACSIGTATHNRIEDFLENNPYSDDEFRGFENPSFDSKKKILNGFNSFRLWWDTINANNVVEVLSIEVKKSCPWFGGTYDMLVRIDGKNYIVDFKTSNSIGYKYFLQLSAYWYLNRDIQVDGMIILQVSKTDVSFNEYVVDLSIPKHYDFMQNCLNCFASLVNGYFWSERVKTQCKQFMEECD